MAVNVAPKRLTLVTTPAQHAVARAFKAALMTYGGTLKPPLTSLQADGIVANAYRESSMNPKARQPDGSGQGLLQITGQNAHAAFTTIMGVEPAAASIDQQAEYLIRQFAGQVRAGYDEVRAYRLLALTKTAEEAADAFLVAYEHSASAQAHDGKDAARNHDYLPVLYGLAVMT